MCVGGKTNELIGLNVSCLHTKDWFKVDQIIIKTKYTTSKAAQPSLWFTAPCVCRHVILILLLYYCKPLVFFIVFSCNLLFSFISAFKVLNSFHKGTNFL